MTTPTTTTTTNAMNAVDVSSSTPTATPPPDVEIEAVADKLFADLLGATNTYATAIGAALGWYEALAQSTGLTSTELADNTTSDERYAREWLEQQTLAGYVAVQDATAAAADRRYTISPATAEVFVNPDSLAFMAPLAQLVTALGSNLDHLIEAYRTGDGFGWHQHGDGARCGQAEANRPLYVHLLGQEYLAAIDDVHHALSNGGRVADVGCGFGWSSIGVAQAYPKATVDGFDIDAPSVERATANAIEAGVADRVSFRAADVGTVEAAGYDVALALECVHDMPDPVSVLAAMRSMVKPGGAVIVMDERVGETFTGEPDPIEHLLYGFSLLCCLPDGRNAEQSVATGTIMRPETLEGYARDAGFSGLEILPLENDFFRFYRLEF